MLKIDTLTPSELEVVLAYRKLGNRDSMSVTKLEGKLDCKITTQSTMFIASDEGVLYNIHTDKSHE